MRDTEALMLLCGLFRIAWIDGREKRIPNKILMILLIVRIVLLFGKCVLYRGIWVSEFEFLVNGFWLGGCLLLAVHLMFPKGLGAGDVKLFAVIGAYLGREPLIFILFLSVLYASVYSIGMLLLKRDAFRNKFSFAPFIFLGVLTTMMIQ